MNAPCDDMSATIRSYYVMYPLLQAPDMETELV